MKIKLGPYRTALGNIYDGIERYVRQIPGVACKEGCSYCCEKFTAEATSLEIANIVRKINKIRDREAVQIIKQRIDALIVQYSQLESQASQNKGDLINLDLSALKKVIDSNTPHCPFLLNGKCLIYSARPLLCRYYVSSSLEECKRRAPGEAASTALLVAQSLEYKKAKSRLNEATCNFLRTAFPDIKSQFDVSIPYTGPV